MGFLRATALFVLCLTAPLWGQSEAPSEEECRRFAEALEEALENGDGAYFDRAIDVDAILDLATEGVEVPPPMAQGFREGVKDTFAIGTTLVQTGSEYRFLSFRTVDGRPRCLFRVLSESGVNYHELLLAKGADGSVRVVDFYVYLTGERFSESMRRSYVQSLADRPGVVARLLGKENEYAKSLPLISRMADLVKAGESTEALRVYRKLPDVVRKGKTALLLRLQAAQGADEKEYLDSIDDYRNEFPNDPGLDLVTFDGFLLRKQFAETLACLDRLDRSVGGDPYLQVLRGFVHQQEGKRALAKESYRKAIEEEATLRVAYWNLIALSLEDEDFAETARLLAVLEDEVGLEMGDLESIPEYAGFIKSDEYRKWMERRGK